jgi:single-strand DNA-binding protein
MAYDIKGTVLRVFATKQVSEKFSKRELVVEVPDGKYPQTVLFQLTGDRCALLDDITEHDEVSIAFNVRGREWKSPSGEVKYFTTLDVWKIERTSPAQSRPAPAAGGNADDIPF